MILLLHNRYRVTGGEERAVEDLRWLIPAHLGEPVELLQRDSADMTVAGAARGLLRGGLDEAEVAAAVRRTGARVLHAHNVHPSFGWRALRAAREAGARVVLHLHNYRLVCANGVCFTQGEDCTRCQGRRTLPGVRLNCRDASRAESAVYAAGIAAQQRRLGECVDAFVVPSAFALRRLHELRAPVDDRARVIASVQREFAAGSRAADGRHVLFAGRLTREKGIEDAIEACRRAGLPLVVAGDGPLEAELRRRAPEVDFRGRVGARELGQLRATAAVAVVPSRYEEILPLAALEAMAAGVPLVCTRSGGLSEVCEEEGLAPRGDAAALAERLQARFGDAAAGERGLALVRELSAPERVAARLAEVYGGL